MSSRLGLSGLDKPVPLVDVLLDGFTRCFKFMFPVSELSLCFFYHEAAHPFIDAPLIQGI